MPRHERWTVSGNRLVVFRERRRVLPHRVRTTS